MTLTKKNTVISTDTTIVVTFGGFVPLWLCLLSCACCSFSTVFPEEQQVILHP